MDVDVNAVLAATVAQRNAALDEVALLQAAVKQLQGEVDNLKESSGSS